MITKNGVMMQGFHWYSSSKGDHWNYLSSMADDLANAGITALWVPPPYKCDKPCDKPVYDVGYGPYDLYDLGEFPQKCSVRTKYGTKEEFLNAVRSLKKAGVQVYIDAVFNHRGGADGKEDVQAIIVDKNDRTREIPPWRTIRSWTRFDFAGRLATEHGRRMSTKTYSRNDFDAVDWDDITKWPDTVFKIKAKPFETPVSKEKGNFDYLMYADHDMDVQEVVDDLFNWGLWILEETDADGFRFDAVKHIRSFFFRDFIGHVRNHRQQKGREVFAVGEYWEYGTRNLHDFILDTYSSISLFDAPLQNKFHQASVSSPRNAYDLRSFMGGTLMFEQPTLAVTLVDNHDTQPYEGLYDEVCSWFKPLAYTFILLREEGYPCIFLPDWTGAEYESKGQHVTLPSHQWILRRLLAARQHCGYGPQLNYMDYANTIGWTRLGDAGHKHPMAVLIANGSQDGWKWMEVGRADTEFVDILGHRPTPVTTNMHGWGCFTVAPESCSVWVPRSSLPFLQDMYHG